ncbi:hypothetical protein ACS8E2_12815 [Psychrobacter glaciei]|uniref:hypothetical protein n=1 Tax=Psychrobacter glaciei TaxID=619771 RepID=UPI003F45205E
MSFLNPVNESVLRFSSTDASAPQINYNVRVSGDVKAVLKSCLVTGYGAKASAGWTAVNEAGNVIEFLSSGAAMSDYRLGIDDTSTSNTTWYYQYQDARVDPVNNACKKVFTYIDKVNASNGWELLVTTRGLLFIEKLYHSDVSKTVARVTYWGQLKSVSATNSGVNIGFWSAGHGSSWQPYQFFSDPSKLSFSVNGYSTLEVSTANIESLKRSEKLYSDSVTDLMSSVYLYKAGALIAEHPAILVEDSANSSGLYGIRDKIVQSRNVLHLPLSREVSPTFLLGAVRVFLVYLDYWEY